MRTISSIAVSAAFILSTHAAPAAAQTLTARASSPVTLDFHAAGADGRAVLDLTPTDVALKIAGKPRELRSLTLVQLAALPPPFASNADADAGREILLVVDDDSIAPGKEQSFKDAALQLLDTLSPRDRVGFVTIPRGRGNVNRTTQHAAIRAAVSGMAGQAQTGQTDADLLCRTLLTLESLKSIFASMRGASTTVVFFSASLAGPTSEAKKMGQSSGTCEVKPDAYRDVATVVATSPAILYVVNLLDGTAAPETNATLAAGLENLAGVTGADLIRVSGGTRNALARVTRDTSFYRASFEPEATERDGNAYRVEVRTPRDGVKLRAQSQIVIPKLDAKAEGKSASPSPRDMLRVPTVYRDLGIHAAAFASRQKGDEVKIVVLFEPAERSSPLKSAAVGLFDERGKLARQWTAEAADLVRMPAMAALTAPSGVYRLRVAVADAAGHGGTTDEDVRAEIVRADPVKLSTMLLGTPSSGTFSPRLQFVTESAAVGYLEVYGVPKDGNLAATIELRETADGPPLGSVPATVQAGNADDFRIVFGGLTIDSLKPGDYLLVVNLTLDGKPAGRAVRTLRKVNVVGSR